MLNLGEKTDVDIRLEALRVAQGDLSKAKEIYKWLSGQDHSKVEMFLVKIGSDPAYEVVEEIENNGEEHYFHDAIKKLVNKSSGSGVEEITLILSLKQFSVFYENAINKYVKPENQLNTICGKSVENIDGFEYSFLGIRINVFSNSDKNIKEMKKQVPYLSDKIYIGQKSVLLDTTAPSDEGHIDRLGVLLKETNDNK